jgi:hypothetical protein
MDGNLHSLLDYSGEDDDRLRQVALLIAVTRGEHSLNEEKGRYETGYVARAHLPVVERAVGYVGTPIEQVGAAERGRSGWGQAFPGLSVAPTIQSRSRTRRSRPSHDAA